MELNWTVSDLIQMVAMLVAVIGSYWKLSGRLSIVEDRQWGMDKRNREEQGRIEKKLDELTQKIDELIREVTTLKAQNH